MPIAKLFVEGRLELEVLTPILSGTPVLQMGGSKNALRPRAFNERKDNRVDAGYIRDRDFDFEPPTDTTRPTVDGKDDNTVFGWRWCRHEFENYLLDPAIVVEAAGCSLADIEAEIRNVANRIRDYQAARWTIGEVRRELPRHYDLTTRPEDLNDIDLPETVDRDAVFEWSIISITEYRERFLAATDRAALQNRLESFALRFGETFTENVNAVLTWFSGKDLLAAMNDWIESKGHANPGAFRGVLRDWVRMNPDKVLDLLPEWSTFVEILRQ